MIETTARRLLVAASAALVLYLFVRSLRWPLIHDAAVMHYVAWLIGQGAVPYRDIFDMNTPGVYLIHLTVLAVGGPGDVIWRLFDVSWLAVISTLAYLYCRPVCDRWSAAMAGLLFAIHHVGGGASLAGQRDFLLCPFLLAGAAGVARSSERGGRLGPLVGAGVALGVAATVKPVAILFLVVCLGAAAIIRHRAGESWLEGAAALMGAWLIAPAIVLGWLAWVGGLADFYQILTQWTLPIYGQVNQRSPWRILVTLNWGLLGSVALLGVMRAVRKPYGVRPALAGAGVLYGLAHFGVQAKGYDYHLYPLALFCCLLSAFALAPDMREPRVEPAGLLRYRSSVALVLICLTVIVMAGRSIHRLNQFWEPDRVRRVNEVVADVKKLLPPRETVQVLGPPGAHVLLRLKLRQPTRFFTDFQFYIPRDPRLERLRSEFMSGLEARPPAAIVAFPGGHASDPFARLIEFPALSQFIQRRYVHAIEGNGYRIYTRRPMP